MSNGLTIRETISRHRESITGEIKVLAKGKEYFNGMSLPPEQFLDVIIKDYLETLTICYETGSMAVLIEKLQWFKNMVAARRGEELPDHSLTDFYNIINKSIKKWITEPEDFMYFLEKTGDLISGFDKGEEI